MEKIIDDEHIPTNQPCLIRIPTRDAMLGEGMPIRRALPARQKRLIGAWCFLDHVGPATLESPANFFVGPHPHIGLQTFTWMIKGETSHIDSLGYHQIIRPGEINLMTAGHGISHVEMSSSNFTPEVHIAQLWIALPDSHRNMPAKFEHYNNLPIIQEDNCKITVLAGEFKGHTSPVEVYTPLMGADIVATADSTIELPLNPAFEYGILVLEGHIDYNDESLEQGALLYIGADRTSFDLSLKAGTRLLLIGGEPFKEDVILWWNFVARTTEEVKQAVQDWLQGDRFGLIPEYNHRRLDVPTLPEHLKASR